ncbi:hypothetical protein N0O92_12380 [Alkalihalobacillus sp. MEB130]|uniref:hypothetical protein n=1 Tax=Alkalihalobacillus sp. MEB130 TaxID=2976704 RepID=UPI0028DFAE4E|nr:hypothetical protein [Alkalihalobacillus sp. MEB130]MDT8861031.1 hypothetical protein [Alkalihalobacillus sp. MEB130]
MDLKEPELKNAIQQFDELILDIPDEVQGLLTFKAFILQFLKTKTTTVSLPVADVMAIIKQKKPFIFSMLRKEYSNNIAINIVTHNDTDYREAYRNLQLLRTKLGIVKRY